jgi:hypothetical protein
MTLGVFLPELHIRLCNLVSLDLVFVTKLMTPSLAVGMDDKYILQKLWFLTKIACLQLALVVSFWRVIGV